MLPGESSRLGVTGLPQAVSGFPPTRPACAVTSEWWTDQALTCRGAAAPISVLFHFSTERKQTTGQTEGVCTAANCGERKCIRS